MKDTFFLNGKWRSDRRGRKPDWIITCTNCIHLQEKREGDIYISCCDKKDGREIDVPLLTTPDWCPLPEVK